jgi:hypothetical protein
MCNLKIRISQLMAYVNAANQNWNTDNLQFEIINTIWRS